MSEVGSSPAGLFGSLRRLGHTALDVAKVRLELFGAELEQEKLRLFDALLQAALGLMLAGLALVMAIGFVVLLFQPPYRLPAVGVLAVVLAVGAVLMLRAARNGMQARDGGPFALTLGELRRDRAALGADAEERPPTPSAPPVPPAAPVPPPGR